MTPKPPVKLWLLGGWILNSDMDNREPWVLTAAQGSLRQNPKLSKARPWVRSEGQAQGKGTTLARILWGSPTGEKRHPSGAPTSSGD